MFFDDTKRIFSLVSGIAMANTVEQHKRGFCVSVTELCNVSKYETICHKM